MSHKWRYGQLDFPTGVRSESIIETSFFGFHFLHFDGWSCNQENSYRTSGAIYWAVKGPTLISGVDLIIESNSETGSHRGPGFG